MLGDGYNRNMFSFIFKAVTNMAVAGVALSVFKAAAKQTATQEATRIMTQAVRKSPDFVRKGYTKTRAEVSKAKTKLPKKSAKTSKKESS